MKEGHIHVGTSGWHYKHWKNIFYPEGLKEADQLPFYSTIFSSVEINNSFYHLPDKSTFSQWIKKVPEKFLFSVKASRYITHMKKLKDCEEALAVFIQHASVLKKQLGPVLFQLPPGWKINVERFESFLKILPPKVRYAFEFRNHSWYDERIYKLLKKYQCAFCIYELEHHISPFEVTANFVYIRLHGPEEKYNGSYSSKTLKQWVKRCHGWAQQGKDVFLYFDNDQKGYAAFNAQKIRALV